MYENIPQNANDLGICINFNFLFDEIINKGYEFSRNDYLLNFKVF